MSDLASPSEADAVRPVIWKLRALGLKDEAEALALFKLIGVRARISRGQETIGAATSSAHLAMGDRLTTARTKQASLPR